MVKLITNISEAVETSLGQPVGEGFYLFIIHYTHNCLEDMLKNLHGNGDVHTLGSMKGFSSVWTMGVSEMLVGTVMTSGERVYVFR